MSVEFSFPTDTYDIAHLLLNRKFVTGKDGCANSERIRPLHLGTDSTFIGDPIHRGRSIPSCKCIRSARVVPSGCRMQFVPTSIKGVQNESLDGRNESIKCAEARTFRSACGVTAVHSPGANGARLRPFRFARDGRESSSGYRRCVCLDVAPRSQAEPDHDDSGSYLLGQG